MQGRDREIDSLDADKRNDDAAEAVDQQVALQQRAGSYRTVTHALQRKRNQGYDNQRIEDDCRKNRALRAGEIHDVERLKLWIEGHEHRRDDGEILRHVVSDRERGERAPRHEKLLADLDDLKKLCRVRI